MTMVGTSIELDTGLHVIMVTDTVNGCVDIFEIDVTCPDEVDGPQRDTIEMALIVGFTDTLCINVDEVPGTVTSVTNNCEDLSGLSADIFILDEIPCIEITGDAVGVDTACLVACNDLGVCDTTILIVNIIPPTIDTVEFTIAPTESGTYCVDTTELAGTITSINNICPQQAGDAVDFEVVSIFQC